MTDVAEETTAAAIWARLESLYMSKSLPRAFIKQLYSFRMVESKTIEILMEFKKNLMIWKTLR